MADEKKPQQSGSMKVWTYTEATKAVPLVRGILHDLRQVYVRMWHLFKVNKYQCDGGEHHEELLRLRDEGGELLRELDTLFIYPYERPTRGIVLFPFVVQSNDGGTRQREAWFVYKDSCESIDTYAFNDELCKTNDLLRCEKPVPEEWKTPGAVPKLNQESKP